MRLGLLGGTFDPPHIAHLILAEEALCQLKLDRVLWVLTPNPPHKRGRQITPLETRLNLLQAALAENSAFEISSVDIDRLPPHYAVDTLRILHDQFPSSILVYLIGGDSLGDLPEWHEPDEFLRQCDELGVMLRPGWEVNLNGLELALPGISAKVHILQAPLLEISSNDLRKSIARGGAYRYYLPQAVFQMIERDRLYRKLPDPT